jgi:Cu(I)/Ag(I) efflux system membrane protein CusA/SilA
MIDRVIEFSAKNKLLVFALTAAAAAGGWWSLRHVALDAIPDLSDTQVIIYSRWDRSPDILEAQVTYPIVTAMLGAPRVKAVRGFSDFGYSYVYAIFEDGTDIYWARSRTLEYLSGVLPRLPEGVKTELGPDASGLGWIYQYVLVDQSGGHNLAELRSCQDWYLRYHLKSVSGVAEVAALGGFGKQYQVNVDPNRPASRSAASSRPCAAATATPGGACSSSAAPSTWCAGTATRAPSATSRTLCSPPVKTARRSASRMWDRSCSALTSAGAWPTWTAPEMPSPASSSCAWARMR